MYSGDFEIVTNFFETLCENSMAEEEDDEIIDRLLDNSVVQEHSQLALREMFRILTLNIPKKTIEKLRSDYGLSKRIYDAVLKDMVK